MAQRRQNTPIRNEDSKARKTWMMSVKKIWKIVLLLLRPQNTFVADKKPAEKNTWSFDIQLTSNQKVGKLLTKPL